MDDTRRQTSLADHARVVRDESGSAASAEFLLDHLDEMMSSDRRDRLAAFALLLTLLGRIGRVAQAISLAERFLADGCH